MIFSKQEVIEPSPSSLTLQGNWGLGAYNPLFPDRPEIHCPRAGHTDLTVSPHQPFYTRCSVHLALGEGAGTGTVLLLQAEFQLAEHSKVCASFPGMKTNSNNLTATFSVILLSLSLG